MLAPVKTLLSQSCPIRSHGRCSNEIDDHVGKFQTFVFLKEMTSIPDSLVVLLFAPGMVRWRYSSGAGAFQGEASSLAKDGVPIPSAFRRKVQALAY
jgi:hypothetical protein